MKKYPGNYSKQNFPIPQCQKKVCLWVLFLALDILGYFWEGFRPTGFRAPGQGRIGLHPELYILAPQWAFSGRMSRMLGYLEGG